MVIVGWVLQALVVAAWLVVLGRVVLSWLDPGSRRPISRFLYVLTEPFLTPIRNVLPRTGMFDLSPLVLLLGLGVIMRLVLAL